MDMPKPRQLFFCLFIMFCRTGYAQPLYFPPINNNLPWDTVSPASLGWCTSKIDSLYSFLELQNSKGFIVLKDGKIVLEKYFGSFTQDSAWYWASAGKTLTSFLVGKAQEEGFLHITDTSAHYLGSGWTSCTPAQENAITIRHQLTMTSGFNDGLPDSHCLDDSCLICLAAPGTRWAYHNAPYTLLDSVITVATGQTLNSYTNAKLRNTIGMSGIWIKSGYDNVFYSKPRSMARFGLLMLNKGKWNTTPVMADTNYLKSMTTPSQALNKSYGYLWWLNGYDSYMLPTSQIIVPGEIVPQAPPDMYAGIGKNGQLLCVVPSKNMVVIRMGNPNNATNPEVSTILCNQIWERLNAVMCYTPNQYVFTGSGDYENFNNWEHQLKPPIYLPVPYKIIINPQAGGFCKLNTMQYLTANTQLIVAAGARFIVTSNFIQF